MPRRRETLQLASQLGQDVDPTGSPDPIQDTTRPHRQGRPSLLGAFRSYILGLPFWEKVFWGGGFILWMLFVMCMPRELLRACTSEWIFNRAVRRHTRPSELKGDCTSDWIFDTAAPYHTTNQICAFADDSARPFCSPARYKGVESHGFGLVKLEVQYSKPEAKDKTWVTLPEAKDKTSVTRDSVSSYAPLDLLFTQYVPKQANTISVSQLILHNDLRVGPDNFHLVGDYTLLVGGRNRTLGLRIRNETEIPAQEIDGHYTFRARVPNGACECPDLNERRIFSSQTNGPVTHEFKDNEVAFWSDKFKRTWGPRIMESWGIEII